MSNVVRILPHRSSELLSALVKAAHATVWAEDALLWHEDGPDAGEKTEERDACLSRCERIVLRAHREGILAPCGVRAMVGILFETITLARWQLDAQRPDLSLTRNELMDELRRRLFRTWHAHARVKMVQRLLRIAS
jgi:hypothetical protein